ncbi:MULTISPECIES: MerR family transcriptional regulator [unclassified Brevibacterium]|uniref:MerR family transcriptional regulator n=1 Tax=unclassified Brevibacterium TaxID=2614124 RepID=UPI0010924DCB|nr:MerR family transcriptional regulator [Brevibacterium sp. S22]TGD32637.1 MerR family transcriptional regulator [Brevibacterium sp. S22]
MKKAIDELSGQNSVRVGELADATGLTVRTLHYYDEIGLLTPSERSRAGHRLYSTQDVHRLYRIVALRQLAFGLDDIAAALDDPQWNLPATISHHLERIDDHLSVEHRLRNRLAAVSDALDRRSSALNIHDFLDILEDMSMLTSTIKRRIPTLVYDDIEAAAEFLTTAFGFEPGRLARSPDGDIFHAEVTAGDGVI